MSTRRSEVATAALDKAFVELFPAAFLPCLLMDCREPKGLSPLVERTKIATSTNHAIVKINHLCRLLKYWLYDSGAVHTIQFLHFAPNVFRLHFGLNYRLQIKGKGIEMLRLHVGTQNSWGVLKEFLGVHHCNKEAMSQVTSAKKTRETTTNDQNSTPMRWHCDRNEKIRTTYKDA